MLLKAVGSAGWIGRARTGAWVEIAIHRKEENSDVFQGSEHRRDDDNNPFDRASARGDGVEEEDEGHARPKSMLLDPLAGFPGTGAYCSVPVKALQNV